MSQSDIELVCDSACAPEGITQQIQEQSAKYGVDAVLSGYAALTRPTQLAMNNTDMKLIANDWKEVSIGNICNLINGRAFKPTEWTNNGLPIIRIQNLNNSEANFNYFDGAIDEKHIVSNGDLLFAWSGTPGTSFGAHIWKGQKSVLNQHIFKIVFFEKIVNRDFLRYAINEKLDELIFGAHGGVGLRHITKGKFEGTLIVLPPLAEQQQISGKLDELLVQVDALKTRLGTIPKILKRFRQSVLAAALSGKLTEDWREKFDFEVTVKLYNEKIKEEKFKVKVNNLVPPSPLLERPSWLALQFGHLFNVKSGASLTAKDMATNGTIPVYGGNGITGYHDQSNITEATIVIGRVGFYCGSVHLTENTAWVTDNALIVSFPRSLVTRDFAYFLLKATNLRKDSASTAQPVISGTKIYPIEISLPSTEEQIEIVSRVEQLLTYADQIEQRVKDAQVRVNHLTQSILAKAFRGELTADWREQNPDLISDENSAETLLAKIKAERETIATPKKTKKKAKA